MTIRPIRTPQDHAAAVARIGELWDAAPHSDDAAELDALATLVDAFESRLLQIKPVKPLEVLRYAVTEMGHSQAALARLIGSRSRASEILSGRRALTLVMIRAISTAWKIPVQLLIGTEEALAKRRKARRAVANAPRRPNVAKAARKTA
jgi:HTH-type transcriptional regulator/antitoxin HigA